eukprot:6056880-Pyramimonas_sp.AAC.1
MHLAAKSGSCAATARYCQVFFNRGGGGGGAWRAAHRPARHNDAHWFSTRIAGADMFADVCCHVRRHLTHSARAPK